MIYIRSGKGDTGSGFDTPVIRCRPGQGTERRRLVGERGVDRVVVSSLVVLVRLPGHRLLVAVPQGRGLRGRPLPRRGLRVAGAVHRVVHEPADELGAVVVRVHRGRRVVVALVEVDARPSDPFDRVVHDSDDLRRDQLHPRPGPLRLNGDRIRDRAVGRTDLRQDVVLDEDVRELRVCPGISEVMALTLDDEPGPLDPGETVAADCQPINLYALDAIRVLAGRGLVATEVVRRDIRHCIILNHNVRPAKDKNRVITKLRERTVLNSNVGRGKRRPRLAAVNVDTSSSESIQGAAIPLDS